MAARRVPSESGSGSHRIFVGKIEEAILARGNALIHAQSRFHKLGKALQAPARQRDFR